MTTGDDMEVQCQIGPVCARCKTRVSGGEMQLVDSRVYCAVCVGFKLADDDRTSTAQRRRYGRGVRAAVD